MMKCKLLGIQMNQVYCDSLGVRVDREVSNLNFTKQVMINTFPGYHLPHVWLAKDTQSHKTSILDLSGHGKFSLFTGIGDSMWMEAARTMCSKTKVRFVGTQLDIDVTYGRVS